MQIDWLTVAAQIVNFLVLIWLLQRFLYGPITRAMQRREAGIAQRLADARSAHEEAEAEAQRLRGMQDELEQSRQHEMELARRKAEDLRAVLEQEIRDEMRQKQKAWFEHLEDERAELIKSLNKRFARHATDMIGQILSDFADAEIGDQLAAGFAERLRGIDDAEKRALTGAAGGMDELALVETGIDLSPTARGRITRAIHDDLVDGLKVDYRRADDVLLGIRLTIGGHTVEWSAARYLDRFQRLVGEALDAVSAEARDQGDGDRHD